MPITHRSIITRLAPVGRALRSSVRPLQTRGTRWWMAHGILTRHRARASWATGPTVAEAEQILDRVVRADRGSAGHDLGEYVPALTPAFAEAAVRLGPDVVLACLRRADCTTDLARTILTQVEGLPATPHRTAPHWRMGDRDAVFRVAGARGWSIRDLIPATWQTWEDRLRSGSAAPAGGQRTVEQTWTLVCSVPRVPRAIVDGLLRDGQLPTTEAGERALLQTSSLSADQRWALWQRLVARARPVGTRPFVADFDWGLPGAIEALVDGDRVAATQADPPGAPPRVRAAEVVLRALRAATPAGRVHWWHAIARATPAAVASVLGTLWTLAPGELLGWPDGVHALQRGAGLDTACAVLEAVTTRRVGSGGP